LEQKNEQDSANRQLQQAQSMENLLPIFLSSIFLSKCFFVDEWPDCDFKQLKQKDLDRKIWTQKNEAKTPAAGQSMENLLPIFLSLIFLSKSFLWTNGRTATSSSYNTKA
jgi:hypothetical protein